MYWSVHDEVDQQLDLVFLTWRSEFSEKLVLEFRKSNLFMNFLFMMKKLVFGEHER
jgi:hypothetical protein